jgi:crossover junction endodeoxyribonuclease RuvC
VVEAVAVKVVGLDLSLTATGVAVLDTDGVETGVVKTTGRKTDSAFQVVKRLQNIAGDVFRIAGDPFGDDCLAVIESPGYASQTGSVHERAGLWWKVAGQCVHRGIPVATVTPAALKVYATGKGNATKDVVLASVIKRYSWVDITDNNVADAVVLMAMGARYLGIPIDSPMPQTHLRGLEKVRWPAN